MSLQKKKILLQTLSCYNALIIFSKFKLSNKMKNITENPQNISELLKAKVESFQVEELDSRLEMKPWVEVNKSCPRPKGEEATEE
jgi:hypothetical protein